MKILVVDDDREICETLKDILDEFGYEVITCESGFSAIEMARGEKIDICFIDLKMPGISGIETFREIKKLIPDIKGILITAYYTEDIKEEALREGIGGILEKPVDIQKLLSIIKEVEKKRNAKILLIDDDPVFSETLKSVLSNLGCKVDIALSGEDGVELSRKKKYDFYFIDMKLPGMDGVRTFLSIKGIQPDAKVIMISGHEDERGRMENLLREGVITYFLKPLKLEEIVKLLGAEG